ncbi:hypothetical protein Gpo141_00007585 [Globisporangium polare]
MSPRRWWWRVLCSAALALGASRALLGGDGSPRALSLIVGAPLTPATRAPVVQAATTCLGFLLPDATSVVTTAQCASATRAPYTVVLIGAEHTPLVVTVPSLVVNAHYSEESRDDVLKWRFNTATGSLDAPLTQRGASPVMFSRLPESIQLEREILERYAVHTNANMTTEPAAGDDGISSSMVFTQSAVSLVATSECEAVSGKNLSGTDLLCGKRNWVSLDKCQAAAAPTDQLVTVKQRDGVEAYAKPSESQQQQQRIGLD